MRFTNPILKGDYSDPDVIRVGEDFYLISSSFTYLPGIPVLKSRDLVHWQLVGYAAERLPFSRYNRPAHKRGTWAPSIRYHGGIFYVYVCLPDEGLLAFTTSDPAGAWTCHQVMDVCGWIDPCPLFEEDGTVWLVHGFAASRCGINNLLYVHQLSADGLHVLDKGTLVYNGADHGDVTVEGPKFYKRNGTYWILCPAGGVKPGYQLALRSSSRTGPYERRVVLQQGATPVNGPHQGAWFDDGRGHDWFIHFQDVGPYGRITHLQPVYWSDGWPVMGNRGEPVSEGDTGLTEVPARLQTSDDFRQGPGLQWQWQANPNPDWWSVTETGLRLNAAPAATVFEAGQFLSQLPQDFRFTMETELVTHFTPEDRAGVAVMGYTYYSLAVEEHFVKLLQGRVWERGLHQPEQVTETVLVQAPRGDAALPVKLRVRVWDGELCFSYAEGNGPWQPFGGTYAMTAGGWTGARPGIFCLNTRGPGGGWAEARYVHFIPGETEISP